MTLATRFIGYGLAPSFQSQADTWTDSRRAAYLYKPDAPFPISVGDVTAGEDLLESNGYGFVGLTANAPVLPNAAELVIAISVYPDRWTQAQFEQWDGLVFDAAGRKRGFAELTGGEVATPEPLQLSLLGYDVADWGLISGLSNCGFMPEEPVSDYRAKWGPKLNAHHLFDDIEAAYDFAKFTDQRVPEHAPFYVFGVWQKLH